MRTLVFRKRSAVLALTTSLVLLAAPGSALADSSGTTGKPASGDGAAALCKRVPRIEKRLDRVLERVNGGVAVRGSTAYLERRIANAEKLGHDDVAALLTDRLEFRKKLPAEITKRQAGLAKVGTWCADNGFTAGQK